jgi:tetratricopeptide (TPR) repeat protein
VRTSLTLGLVLAATGIVSAPLLDVYRAAGEPGFREAVSDAASALIVAALLAGVVAAFVAVLDGRARPSREQERRAGRALGVAAACVAVIGLVLFVGAYGSPFTVAKKGWHEFKTEPSPYGGESRFTGSLGTNRYDFWRVAWDRFGDRPLAGIGADNFQEAYLAERRSDNAPKYPHSLQLRAVSQTGLVGAALLFLGLGAALAAALMAIRRRRGLGAAAAAAGTASFLYWVIHGSIDWFWEFPALGGAAFALLGLAAGLLPRPAEKPRPPGKRRPPAAPAWLRPARVAAAVGGVLALLSLGAPWLAEVEQKTAVGQWRADPAAAFDTLDSAASLNPLSPTPKLLAGSIALRVGQRADSERYFREAIERDPDDAYAHLELGALLAERGRKQEAVATLERAQRLDPRDDLTAGVLRRVRHDRPVDIAAVNRQLAARSARLGR